MVLGQNGSGQNGIVQCQSEQLQMLPQTYNVIYVIKSIKYNTIMLILIMKKQIIGSIYSLFFYVKYALQCTIVCEKLKPFPLPRVHPLGAYSASIFSRPIKCPTT